MPNGYPDYGPGYGPESPNWDKFSVSVLVYEKNGLKRGPGITSATFSKDEPYIGEINVTGGGPLGTPLYQVRVRAWRPPSLLHSRLPLRVGAGRHYPEVHWVRDGDSFEVRLQRY